MCKDQSVLSVFFSWHSWDLPWDLNGCQAYPLDWNNKQIMFEVVIGRDRADWENEWDIQVS